MTMSDFSLVYSRLVVRRLKRESFIQKVDPVSLERSSLLHSCKTSGNFEGFLY